MILITLRESRNLLEICYLTLVNSVPLHLGQGGNVSESSSSRTVWEHARHLYVPLPGFSPVFGIVLSPLTIAFDPDPLDPSISENCSWSLVQV